MHFFREDSKGMIKELSINNGRATFTQNISFIQKNNLLLFILV